MSAFARIYGTWWSSPRRGAGVSPAFPPTERGRDARATRGEVPRSVRMSLPGVSDESEPRPLELLLEVAKRQAQRGRPPVRAVAGALDELAPREQRFDLAGRQR